MKRIAIDINDVIRDFTHQFNKIYNIHIDPTFEMEDSEIEDFDYFNVFPFDSKDDYHQFRYIDFAYELYGRAEMSDSRLLSVLGDWVDKVLKDLDNPPEVMYVSPFEMYLTIQSTLAWLASHGTRVRDYYFPVDSMTIYDRCDVLITANPNLIENCPEGKTVIKINTPYNKDVNCEYSFDSLYDVIKDENETIIKLVDVE